MTSNTSFKNIAFSSLIKINGRQYEFNFRKMPATQSTYEADVTDDRGDRLMFVMIGEDHQWRIHGALIPAWIEENATRIGEAIEQSISI